MRKIDVMIVGAQKAGTTSLNNYLATHPAILGHPQTEFPYFRDNDEFQKGYEFVFKKYFTKGDLDAKIVLAKNTGIYNSEKAVERLYRHNPNCKQIYILRKPVSRAMSSYNMEIFNGWLKRDFKELKLTIEKEKYDDVLYRLFINLGLYSKHLKMMLNYFPKAQMKIFLFEDLKTNPYVIYKEICDWLKVDNGFLPNFDIKHNQTKMAKSQFVSSILIRLRRKNNPLKRGAKWILPYSIFTKIGNFLIECNKSNKQPKPISLEMKIFLSRYFEPYNSELKALTKLNLDKWKNKSPSLIHN